MTGTLHWSTLRVHLFSVHGEDSLIRIFPFADWPSLIVDDGLLTANQVLRDDCAACTHCTAKPHISNVVILSVQPERNIQLFPSSGEYHGNMYYLEAVVMWGLRSLVCHISCV